jgi:hypothetical protein
MPRIYLRSFWGSLVIMGLLVGLPFFFCSGAYARGGGGFVGGGFMMGGGLSGGSFRAGGGWGEAPRSGFVVRGHQEGAYGRVPRGGWVPYGGGRGRGEFGHEAVRGPVAGEVATGGRGEAIPGSAGTPKGAHMVTMPGNWGPYYGPAWNAAAAGAAAALGTGMLVNTLPSGAVPTIVKGRRYYHYLNTYYLPCYLGSVMAYCVVPDPNQ